jgi:hypothetical protein
MDAHPEGPVQNASDHENRDGSSTPSILPIKHEDIENNIKHTGSSTVVDAATEKRLLRKLDIRIIPMICWIYLMNFMDRGTCVPPTYEPDLTVSL